MSNTGLDRNRVLPIFALVFVDVLGLTIILPLLHLYGAAYGASPFEIGLVAAAFPLAQLIGVPMMGALSDRFGRKPLLLISQITTFASFILLGFANSLLLVILSRLIDGLFGANLATAQAALSDITSEENRTRALGLTGAAFGIGFIFGPIISLIALQFTDDLSIPAYIAAAYSFISILMTLFMFRETLPPEQRGQPTDRRSVSPAIMLRVFAIPGISMLLVLMFAQQVIFFGFESLLGLFTLTRLGLLGQGNALIFLVVGVILVIVQVKLIGPWSEKYGERKVVAAALAFIAAGMILAALTPQQPHPLYVRAAVENDLTQQSADGTEAIIGDIQISLPDESNRGFFGLAWMLVAVVPLSIGAGLIRPSLNSLMTKRTDKTQYGSVLGVSQSFVSAANAISPLVGGLLFQQAGPTIPFLIGGIIMAALAGISLVAIDPVEGKRETAASL